MQPIKCFIFDLDGTLVFNERANFLAYKAAFASVDLVLKEADFMPSLRKGGDINTIYSDYIATYDLTADKQQLDTIKKVKVKEYAKRHTLIEQNHAIVGILKALAGHYHTALTTTAKKTNALGVLEHFGLTNLFGYMVFAEDVTNLKPDPECHLKVAKHFAVSPNECLIFEDSSNGFAAAKAFGAHLCKVVQ